MPIDWEAVAAKHGSPAGGGIDWNAVARKNATAPRGGGIDWSAIAAKGKPKQAASHDPSFLRRIEAGAEWAANSPVARGLDAVLNATSRASVSALGALGVSNPLTAAAHGVMTPAREAEATHELERRLHLPVAGKGANWAQNLGQAVEDFGVETAADPATYFPGLDVVSVGGRLAKALGLGKLAKRVAEIPAVDQGLSSVVEGRELRKGVTRAGEDIVKGRQAAGKNTVRRQEQAYTDLIERHRPALEAAQAKRAEIEQQIAEADTIHGQRLTPAEWKNLPEAAQQARKANIERLQGELEATNQLIPEEIRQALLQRAYREGTPGVRRQVLARGYVPTAEDQARAPLNILHAFRDEYEPTQRLFEPADIEAGAGPLRWMRQGNKKARFDLPKTGGKPQDPLADRLLDRLVRGARIEEYHGTRRDILRDLGAVPDADRARALGRLSRATEAGDTARAQRYAALIDRQNAAANAAAARRAQTLREGAPEEQQALEILDPLTARRRALSEANIANQGFGAALPTRTVRTKGGEEERLVVNPRSAVSDTRELKGRIASGRRAVADTTTLANILKRSAQRAQAGAEGALETYAGSVGKATSKAKAGAEKAAQGLLGKALAAKATTEERAARAFPGQQEASAFVDPYGRPILKPSTPTRKQAILTRPVQRLAGQVGQEAERSGERFAPIERAAAQTPSLARAINPSQRASAAGEKAVGRAATRVEKAKERKANVEAVNDTIEAMREDARDLTSAANTVTMPASVQRRLFGDMPRYNESLLATFSDLQRDALFVLPFAHMKNISVLAALGPGGLKTVKNGMKIARELRTNPEKYADRVRGLEDVGATAHYIKNAERQYEKVPIVGPALDRAANASSEALDRYDLGMRLALEDQLRKDGFDGFALGGQIRDILGDYENQAPKIEELRRRWGANFPGWGLGVVPRAMTKALRERPRAFKAYARAQQVLSQDVTEPAFGAELDMGGPAEDYGELLTAPQKFLTSESRIGPVRSLFDVKDAVAKGHVGELAGRTLLGATPFGTIIGAAANFPYPSNAPAIARAAASLPGVYFPNKLTMQQREYQLRNLGMKGPEIYAVLRQEGYLHEPGTEPASPSGNPFAAVAPKNP